MNGMICSRGPARASVTVLACRPCPASKGVYDIVDRSIEGSIMRKGYHWEIVLHVVILGVITFGKTPVEVLHKALYNCVWSRVVRCCSYLDRVAPNP